MTNSTLRANPAATRAWIDRSRKRMANASAKQAEKLKTYYKLRAEFLAAHPMCEFPKYCGCCNRSRDVHHMQGRGPNLNRVKTWMAICRKHHKWIHANPREARAMDLLR